MASKDGHLTMYNKIMPFIYITWWHSIYYANLWYIEQLCWQLSMKNKNFCMAQNTSLHFSKFTLWDLHVETFYSCSKPVAFFNALCLRLYKSSHVGYCVVWSCKATSHPCVYFLDCKRHDFFSRDISTVSRQYPSSKRFTSYN
jgi:hypothetical protein